MQKTLVLGLDGATFRVLDPLMDEGILENISALAESGVRGTLKSSMPPVTGPAWLSLATGRSPGSTGIYDFIYRTNEEGYDFEYLDSSVYQGRSVWDYLGEHNVEVGVMDYPTLSPPYPVNGFVASNGLGAGEGKSYPRSLIDDLDQIGEVESHLDISDPSYSDLSRFVEDASENLHRRAQRLKHLLDTECWQFCWAVFQEPDWAQHLMWKCFDEEHPQSEHVSSDDRALFKQFWKNVDDAVGDCLEMVDDDTNVILQSDHGFGPMYDRSFRLNTWLLQEGYLAPKSMGSQQFWVQKRIWNTLSSIASAVNLEEYAPRLFSWGKNQFSSMAIELGSIDLGETVAFDPGHIQSMGGIYVNRKVVAEQDVPRITTEIRKKLGKVGDENDLEIETYTPEELYRKTTPESPDIIVRIDGINVENSGWDKPIIDSRPERLSHQNGSHRQEGVLIASGPNFKQGKIEDATVWDLAPTILHCFECPVPTAMDGQVLQEALAFNRPVEREEYADERKQGTRLSNQEKEEMQQQLSNLGYFE